MGRPPPTCPEGLGHQPGQIAGDFGSGEVVVVEGLDGRNNERPPPVPGVRGIPHPHALRAPAHPSHGAAGRGAGGSGSRPKSPGPSEHRAGPAPGPGRGDAASGRPASLPRTRVRAPPLCLGAAGPGRGGGVLSGHVAGAVQPSRRPPRTARRGAPRRSEPRGLAGATRSGESGGPRPALTEPRTSKSLRRRQSPSSRSPSAAARTPSARRSGPARPAPARAPPAAARALAASAAAAAVFSGCRTETARRRRLRMRPRAGPPRPPPGRVPATRGACAVGAAARRASPVRVQASGPGARRPLALLAREGGSGDAGLAGAFGLSRAGAEAQRADVY